MSDTTKTIKVSNDVYKVLEEVKTMFSQVVDKDDLSDEDVIATLLAGFVDGMKNQTGSNEGCCSGEGCAC